MTIIGIGIIGCDKQAQATAQVLDKVSCTPKDLGVLLFLLETGAYLPIVRSILESQLSESQIKKIDTMVAQLKSANASNEEVSAAQVPIVKADQR